MWSKQQAVAEPPAVSPSTPASPTASFSAPSTGRLGGTPARGAARLGASIQIKGQITGNEDLQIDGIVDGPISLQGHELTVGPEAQLKSEIIAGDVVAYGKVVGNVQARGRVTSGKTAPSSATFPPPASASKTAPTSRAVSKLIRPNPNPPPNKL